MRWCALVYVQRFFTCELPDWVLRVGLPVVGPEQGADLAVLFVVEQEGRVLDRRVVCVDDHDLLQVREQERVRLELEPAETDVGLDGGKLQRLCLQGAVQRVRSRGAHDPAPPPLPLLECGGWQCACRYAGPRKASCYHDRRPFGLIRF